MKKLPLLIGLAFVALVSIATYIGGRGDGTSTEPSRTSNSVTRQPTSEKKLETEAISPRLADPRAAATGNATDAREYDIERLRRELKTANAELEKLSRPLAQDILSSTVSAEISPGETLVSGGYKTAEGNYEITFLTPRRVTLSDGREGIEVKSQVLSVGSEFAQENGLDTLTTNARNTLQHAEAWKQDDIDATLSSASNAEGASVISSPRIITLPSTPFAVKMGEVDGSQFALEATVAKNPDGNFSIQSRVERTHEAEQSGGQEPPTRPE